MKIRGQQGYFLIIAVIFIMVIGLMGSLIAYLFANRASISVAQQNGLNAFYMAESGLEIGTRLLNAPTLTGTPTRLACGSLTGTASVTNAVLNQGRFTVSTINSSPVFSVDTLSAAITTTSTTIAVTSSSGFAPSGRLIIDGEAIDYTGISGNTFIGATRGVNYTMVSSHASGAGVGQYQCSLDSKSGIPTLSTPSDQRDLQWNVQLQDAWSVGSVNGSNFTLTHWNYPTELAWSLNNVAGGSNAATLNAVSLLSNADGWAVGNVVGSNFIFLHWNGASWGLATQSGACSAQNLTGISMVSSQEGWAVGAHYGTVLCVALTSYRYTVMKWNGTTWSLLAPSTIPADAATNQSLRAVSVIDTNGDGKGNIGFAVGDAGTILQYNGSTWVKVSSPTSANLYGVATVSASEAWAVGASGVIITWNGSSWTIVSSPTSLQLNAVAMLDTDNNGKANVGFAVGNSAIIATYNGSSWTATDLGSINFTGVAIYNANDAWTVGAGGAAYHWSGNSWTAISSGVSTALNAISVISPGTIPTSHWQQVFN